MLALLCDKRRDVGIIMTTAEMMTKVTNAEVMALLCDKRQNVGIIMTNATMMTLLCDKLIDGGIIM